MENLIAALAADFESVAPEMTATRKAAMYRIYRDTRFSPDKTPYKTHVAAVLPRKGLEKHRGAGFYVHIADRRIRFLNEPSFAPENAVIERML